MKSYKEILRSVLINGEERDTRSGKCITMFQETFTHDMRDGFPAVTTKKLAFKTMMGELLFFLSGKTDLDSLRWYSNLPKDAWTIWTNDAERFGGKGNKELGPIYSVQWRNFNNQGVDQIRKLIDGLKNDPTSRYHRVTAWNPVPMDEKSIALPACHTDFECFVSDDGYLDLRWNQRSVDSFLGLPFNIASYGALMCILGEITGYKPRYLFGNLGNTHIYTEHLDQVRELLSRQCRPLPQIKMPEIGIQYSKGGGYLCDELDHLLVMTASDFGLANYDPHPAINAPLLVG